MSSFPNRQAQYTDIVNRGLENYLPQVQCPQEEVISAARYSLLGGGKRLRPSLLLEFYSLCGGRCEDALQYACAIEMIHTYSLIHDDLPCMDDDDLRRGRPSCHRAFGEATALLAGDALLNTAFELMTAQSAVAPQNALKAAAYIASQAGIGGMIGGQVIDLAMEGKPLEDKALHTQMVSLKTAALFRAACVGGCLLCGADEAKIAAAEEFATAYGLAFQITDDILDVTGDQSKLGKPVGSDQKAEKITYTSIYGIAESMTLAGRHLAQAEKIAGEVFSSDFLQGLCKSTAIRDK